MNEYIPTPTVGEVIFEEFMKPLNMTIVTLADNLGLSVTYTRALLDGEMKVTPELSKRLSDCFGMSELFFFRLQRNIDNRNAKIALIDNPTHEPVHALAFV